MTRCRNCRRGEPCLTCLAEDGSDHSVFFDRGVEMCAPNYGCQELVGALGVALLHAYGLC